MKKKRTLTHKLKKILKVSFSSFKKFSNDEPVKLAATVSFIMLFAIPPILIIITRLLGCFMEQDFINNKLHSDMIELIGRRSANFINEILHNFQKTPNTLMSNILGFFMFIIATTTLFAIIQNSLNKIWRIKPKPKHNLIKSIKDRLLAFVIILSLGFLFFLSLTLDASVTLLKGYLDKNLPDFTFVVIKTIKFLFTFFSVTLIFATMFKLLPDAKVRWKVTWIGAIITAFLFTIGKELIRWAILQLGVASLYGAAGSVIILLLWVFYSSLIFFFGAVFTEQYAEYSDKYIVPKKNAVNFEIKEVEQPISTEIANSPAI